MATRARRISTAQTEVALDDGLIEESAIEIQEAPIELIPFEFTDSEESAIEVQDMSTEPIPVESAVSENEIEHRVEIVENPTEIIKPESVYKHIDVNIVKLAADVKMPFQKSGEGCFDLFANFINNTSVLVIKNDNNKENRRVSLLNSNGNHYGIVLDAYERALIPTNLVFILPVNCVMKIYAKSGLSFNSGLKLTSGVDVINSTYVDPLYVSVYNDSKIRRAIKTSDVIAQAEIVPYYISNFNDIG